MLAQEQEILREFLDTADIDLDSDDDVRRISVCANCKCQPKTKRTLNVARAVRLHSTVVLIAREKTGTSIDSHVRLWPRSRTQRKLNLFATVKDLLYSSVYSVYKQCYSYCVLPSFIVTFINTNGNILILFPRGETYFKCRKHRLSTIFK